MTVNKEEAAMLAAFIFCAGFLLGMIFRANQDRTIQSDQCLVTQEKLNEFMKTSKSPSGSQVQVCINVRVP